MAGPGSSTAKRRRVSQHQPKGGFGADTVLVYAQWDSDDLLYPGCVPASTWRDKAVAAVAVDYADGSKQEVGRAGIVEAPMILRRDVDVMATKSRFSRDYHRARIVKCNEEDRSYEVRFAGSRRTMRVGRRQVICTRDALAPLPATPQHNRSGSPKSSGGTLARATTAPTTAAANGGVCAVTSPVRPAPPSAVAGPHKSAASDKKAMVASPRLRKHDPRVPRHGQAPRGGGAGGGKTSNLFKGMHFIFTKMESKGEMKDLVECNGGVVLASFEVEEVVLYNHVVVIAKASCTTKTFLLALIQGIPVLSYKYIAHSIKTNTTDGHDRFRLSPGTVEGEEILATETKARKELLRDPDGISLAFKFLDVESPRAASELIKWSGGVVVETLSAGVYVFVQDRTNRSVLAKMAVGQKFVDIGWIRDAIIAGTRDKAPLKVVKAHPGYSAFS